MTDRKKLKVNLGNGRVIEAEFEDADFDQEPARLEDGTVLDEAGAAELGEVIARRSRPVGRPSLGAGVSPRVAFRVPPVQYDKLKRLAAASGLKESDIFREALKDYLEKH